MFRKNCHNCNRPSFSSADTGTWHCPVCGEDLTLQKALDALGVERIQQSSHHKSHQDTFRNRKGRT